MPLSPATLLLFAQNTAHMAAHHAQKSGHGHMPPWLIHLGLPGLFVVSLLDAAIIPLPLPGSGDVLLLLLCAQRGSHPVLLAFAAVVASVIGGYTTWRAGQKGGESMLDYFAPKRMIKPVTRWMKSHGFLTIATSALLPPPIPLMPLLLGAGALGASRRQFLTAFALARGIRYGLMAWIGATYGRRVLRVWNHYLANWSGVILWTFFGLLLAAIIFGFWQYQRQKKGWEADKASRANAAPREAAETA